MYWGVSLAWLQFIPAKSLKEWIPKDLKVAGWCLFLIVTGDAFIKAGVPPFLLLAEGMNSSETLAATVVEFPHDAFYWPSISIWQLLASSFHPCQATREDIPAS